MTGIIVMVIGKPQQNDTINSSHITEYTEFCSALFSEFTSLLWQIYVIWIMIM